MMVPIPPGGMMIRVFTGSDPAVMHSWVDPHQNMRRLHRAFDTQVLAAITRHDDHSHTLSGGIRLPPGQFLRMSDSQFSIHRRDARNMQLVYNVLAVARQRMATARLERRRISTDRSLTRGRGTKLTAPERWHMQRRLYVAQVHGGPYEYLMAQRRDQDEQVLRFETGLFEKDMRRLGQEHWGRAGVSMFRNAGQRRLKNRSLIWYDGTPARVQEVLVMATTRVPVSRLEEPPK